MNKLLVRTSTALIVALVCLSLAADDTKTTGGEARGEKQPPASAPVDLYGDPLPPGAVARLGTLRYRHGDWQPAVRFLDNDTLLSVGESGTIRQWEAQTGKLVRETPTGRATAANSADGSLVAILQSDYRSKPQEVLCKVEVWDGKAGQPRSTINWTQSRDYSPRCLAISNDGSVVAVAGGNVIRFWDVATGEEVLKFSIPCKEIQAIVFAPDGESVAVADYFEVYLWRWLAGFEPPAKLLTSQSTTTLLSFSPDSRLLATMSGRGNGVALWDVRTKKRLRDWQVEGEGIASACAAFTSDGKRLAAATNSSYRGRLEFRESATGKLLRSFDAGLPVHNVAISLDDQWLAAVTGNTLRVLNLQSGDWLDEKFTGHEGHVYEMQFTPDGQRIVAPDLVGSVRVWNTQTARQEHHFHHGPGRTIRGLAISPDGKRVATSALDDAVRVWDLESGKQVFRLYGHGDLGGRRAVQFTPDGAKIVSWGDDMFLRVWDARTGKALTEDSIRPIGLEIHEDENGAAKFDDPLFFHLLERGKLTGDASQLLLLTSGSIRWFDAATGKEARQFKPETYCRDFAVSPDSKWLATVEMLPKEKQPKPPPGVVQQAAQALRIRRFDAPEEMVYELPLPGQYPRQLTFSRDGKMIAATGSVEVGGNRFWIAVWSVESGKEMYRITDMPLGSYIMVATYAMAFSPDGKQLAAASSDTTVLIWDLEKLAVK